MGRSSGEITRLLGRLRAGDKEAESRLVPLIYGRLHSMADRYMRCERPDHTLQATALLNEAYVQLVGQEKDWHNRTHFFAVAAQLMRRILIDHARSRRTQKRGGVSERIQLDALPMLIDDRAERLLALDDALSRLEAWDPRLSRVVELRFFGGLTEAEAAEALGISSRTVKRDWSMAKAWLYTEIGQ
jgi:RNA polymerase sigma factor (TIGR02999 family)